MYTSVTDSHEAIKNVRRLSYLLGLFFLMAITIHASTPVAWSEDSQPKGCPTASGTRNYPDRVPHGFVNSCNTCHFDGNFDSPPPNPGFRQDFFNNGIQWDAVIAAMDSDGDGATNGQELQDPTGSWRPGTPAPGNAADVTNPSDPNDKPADTPTPQPTETPSPSPSPTETITPTETPTPGGALLNVWHRPAAGEGPFGESMRDPLNPTNLDSQVNTYWGSSPSFSVGGGTIHYKESGETQWQTVSIGPSHDNPATGFEYFSAILDLSGYAGGDSIEYYGEFEDNSGGTRTFVYTDGSTGADTSASEFEAQSNPFMFTLTAVTPTNTPTSSPTRTSTPTRTPTKTPTFTPTASNTPTPTPTPTKTPTTTNAPTHTKTPTPTETMAATATPTSVTTGTPMPTETPISTGTPMETMTPSPSPTEGMETPTPTPTGTREPMNLTLYAPPFGETAPFSLGIGLENTVQRGPVSLYIVAEIAGSFYFMTGFEPTLSEMPLAIIPGLDLPPFTLPETTLFSLPIGAASPTAPDPFTGMWYGAFFEDGSFALESNLATAELRWLP